MTLSIRSVEKAFGRLPALKGVNLEIAPGELLAILGPSGSGKTTLLRVIAGLEAPQRGQVLFGDRDMTRVGASARKVGFVFQQYALFRHLRLARNISFGLDVRKRADRPARAEIDARVEALLALVELPGLGDRYPGQLSGGQRQRVALARALAVDPTVLLLDEPFGALDSTVRKTLRQELRRIHDATGVTTLFVTHDQDEALGLADRVAILNEGLIEQVATPADLLDHPASAFVAGFVGKANRLEGQVTAGQFRSGTIVLPALDQPQGAALAFVRPHDMRRVQGKAATLSLTVDRIISQGVEAQIEGHTGSGQVLQVTLERSAALGLAVGEPLDLSIDRAHLFSA